jgi:hypothetical protein
MTMTTENKALKKLWVVTTVSPCERHGNGSNNLCIKHIVINSIVLFTRKYCMLGLESMTENYTKVHCASIT